MAKRRPQTPETRRIAAAQALIRRCHSDAEFRKKIVDLWRAQLAQDDADGRRSKKGKRQTRLKGESESK
jgi:hypothetical protein